MRESGIVVAVALGALQGAVEWLPVSSEGFVAVAVNALGAEPSVAVRLALFLHLGTALAATAFYREDLRALATGGADEDATLAADRRFLVVATLVSGVVGIGAYLLLEAVVSALAGGAFLALVGALLVGTGLLLRATSERRLADGGSAAVDEEPAGDGSESAAWWTPAGDRERPDLADAALVGVCQGVAVLPGVSRSGTTVGALLLRGHDGPRSLQLSFLLSIPAAVGAAGIAVADGGLPAVTPVEATVALAVAAVVGYLTVDLLTRLVRRVAFWAVCVGLGALAVLSGLGAAL
ncbi:UDP-diphosphatase [Halobacteriales archaeon SW_7_71_33]|nr:MAG: UDP-diphosphatase [Halobacteriales archaeon SW_7_71_33]